MRPAPITLANLLLALALVSTLGYLVGRQTTEAQPGPPVRSAPPQQLAVVNVSAALDASEDLRDLRRIVELHEQLTRGIQQRAIDDLDKVKEDLAAADPQSSEFDRLMGDYNALAAHLETLASVREYELQLDTDRFVRAVYSKLLKVIELEAQGTYQMVLRVFDDAPEEMDRLDIGDLDRHVRCYRTRTVLFVERDDAAAGVRSTMPDVTKAVVETMNRRGAAAVRLRGYSVSEDLRARIAELERRIKDG